MFGVVFPLIVCILVDISKYNEREIMSTTLNTIKNYTDNATWNVICNCKSCTPKGWLKLDIEELAKLVDWYGIDFTDNKQLAKLNHTLLQLRVK